MAKGLVDERHVLIPLSDKELHILKMQEVFLCKLLSREVGSPITAARSESINTQSTHKTVSVTNLLFFNGFSVG
jgi:hypothetical protein